MAAGKQKNTPVIVMKKKRHIISLPLTEEHVITPPPPELSSGTVENEMPAHQAKKNKKWTPEFINTSLEKVKALFPLLRAEEGGFRPLKIGITRARRFGNSACSVEGVVRITDGASRHCLSF